MSEPNALVKLALAGDRARRACERLALELKGLEGAVKRTLPHLARTKAPVVAVAPRPMTWGEVESLARPFHTLALEVGAAPHADGALVLDANAIAHGMDGMLGSGRGELPALDPGGLSAAQLALARRVARGLAAAFDEVLSKAGTPLRTVEQAVPSTGQAGVLIACEVHIGWGDSRGAVVVLLPVACVALGEADATPPPETCSETQAAVGDVELDVVAELGRVKLPLARVAAFRVGDTLRLPLSVDAPLRLQVGGRALFSGKPTTCGSQIAIEVSGHGA